MNYLPDIKTIKNLAKDTVKYAKEYTVNSWAAQYTINGLRCTTASLGYIDDFEANKVAYNVYVGNLSSASNREMLKALKITHIVAAAYGVWDMFPDDFVYKKVDIIDSEWETIKPHLEDIATFIYDAAIIQNKRVLIHCVAGVSRSAAIAAAYLILRHGFDSNKALEEIAKGRKIIDPNKTFRYELSQLKPAKYNSKEKEEFGTSPLKSDFTLL